MILKYQLILLLMNKLFINGEWIEMPQFSDDSKVYKSSTHNHFHNKFLNDGQKTVVNYDDKTVSQLLNEFGNMDINISEGRPSDDTEDFVQRLQTVTVNPPHMSEESTDIHDDEDDGDFTVIVPNDLRISTDPSISSTLEFPTMIPIVPSTAIPLLPKLKSGEKSSEDRKFINGTKVNLESFEDYLPMEMLKEVHQTLKSQPSTLKGKIRFLKQFEKNLVQEIEARLSSALTPIRRTRGTHDYWDHDEEMGFPSLEGALMAISFLTFAVYLVRLVMLLFRNANNTAAATATTILFRKKRKTSDTLDKKTEEVLNYLYTFDEN